MSSKLIKYLLVFCVAASISACGKVGVFDKYADLTRDEMVDVMIQDKHKKRSKSHKNKNSKDDKGLQEVSIPQISNMLSFPKPPKFTQGNQIISFSITDDVDLKDVLIELGRVTGLDVDIDSKISGGVIINAKNRPLIEVIDRIANLGNLRYSFENDVLTFKSDSSYIKHHMVDYLIDGELWDEVTGNLTSILDATSEEDSSIAPNKSAGIITIFANNAGQESAEDYLAEVKLNASAQVLIEAKVVEVTLNDQYNAGIDWTFLDGGTNISSTPKPAATTNPFNVAAIGSGVLGGDVTASLTALEVFGNVRAISSPRISALNNRKATLDFVDTLVYFTLETEINTTNSTVSTTTNTVTATKNEEPVGVELSITPSIDRKTGEITLEVNPKLSIKSDEVADPSVDSNGNSLGNVVPVIQTRELKTTMKIKSGDTLVIGGLMKEDVANTDTGIPLLSRIPFIGIFFRHSSKTTKVVETVIFIKATIVDSAKGISRYDRDFNRKFTSSKRSF
jgi:MSHA type pilus biogenesis protein MshL